eukprot:SAG11_NODE_15853_length_564_cov_1.232258_1_plen_103_part_01
MPPSTCSCHAAIVSVAATMRTVLITGANAGLGLLTAQRLGGSGRWRVLLGCRSAHKARQAAERVGPAAVPVEAPLELADLASVRGFVDHVLAEHGGAPHVLVN